MLLSDKNETLADLFAEHGEDFENLNRGALLELVSTMSTAKMRRSKSQARMLGQTEAWKADEADTKWSQLRLGEPEHFEYALDEIWEDLGSDRIEWGVFEKLLDRLRISLGSPLEST